VNVLEVVVYITAAMFPT